MPKKGMGALGSSSEASLNALSASGWLKFQACSRPCSQQAQHERPSSPAQEGTHGHQYATAIYWTCKLGPNIAYNTDGSNVKDTTARVKAHQVEKALRGGGGCLDGVREP